MNDFEKAERRASDQHRVWSLAEREKLASDPTAIGQAIRTGAIFSLTKEDREFLIEAHGGPGPAHAELRRPVRKPRRPQPLEPAAQPFRPRQSWTKGEFAHACKNAALWWSAILAVGLIALKIWWRIGAQQ